MNSHLKQIQKKKILSEIIKKINSFNHKVNILLELSESELYTKNLKNGEVSRNYFHLPK